MKHCCPICGQNTGHEKYGKPDPYYPFCSERCRWIDLGHWMNGHYYLEAPIDEESNSEQSIETPESGWNSVDRFKKS